MSYTKLAEGLPGIRGPMVFSPETSKPLNELVQVLLTGPHTLSPAEREMIATYVSSQNDCFYCQSCHGSIAAQHLGGGDADYELISQIKQNYEATPISAKIYRENGKRLAEIGYVHSTDGLLAYAQR
jgi:AhpD family alkylhydroperoxidase